MDKPAGEVRIVKCNRLFQMRPGIKQTGRKTTGFDRWTGDSETARRNRYADGSNAANPRRSAARDRAHRGSCDRATAQRQPEGIPWEHPVAPTTRVRGHKPGPFQERRSL